MKFNLLINLHTLFSQYYKENLIEYYREKQSLQNIAEYYKENLETLKTCSISKFKQETRKIESVQKLGELCNFCISTLILLPNLNLKITIYLRQQKLGENSNLLNENFKDKKPQISPFYLSFQTSFSVSLYQLFQIYVVLFPQKSPLLTICI